MMIRPASSPNLPHPHQSKGKKEITEVVNWNEESNSSIDIYK